MTLRLVEGFPKLRRARALRWIRRCLQLAHKKGFAVVQFSVQGNHLHLIVEAEDRKALSRGMQGLTIRLAKRLNLLFETGGGAVFSERYHAQPLRNPTQVRWALAYVLSNRRKHLAQSGRGMPRGYVDPFSSAPHFDGWARAVTCSHPLPRCEAAAPGRTVSTRFNNRTPWLNQWVRSPWGLGVMPTSSSSSR